MDRVLKIFMGGLFMLSASLAKQVYDLTQIDQRPPIIGELTLVPRPAIIQAGDQLRVRSIREKQREDCSPLTSVRWAINLDTGAKTLIEAKVWEGGAASADYVDLQFNTSFLPRGRYEAWVEVTYPCPGVLPFVYTATFLFKIQ
jgi:hypothetical protein